AECKHRARCEAAAPPADGLEELPGARHVDAVALFEVGLRLAGNDGGEVEDDVRTARHQLVSFACGREVGGHGFRSLVRGGRYDVVEGKLAPATVLNETLGKLAADHARRADDESALYQFGSQ